MAKDRRGYGIRNSCRIHWDQKSSSSFRCWLWRKDLSTVQGRQYKPIHHRDKKENNYQYIIVRCDDGHLVKDDNTIANNNLAFHFIWIDNWQKDTLNEIFTTMSDGCSILPIFCVASLPSLDTMVRLNLPSRISRRTSNRSATRDV